jgi:hypothetical protein
MVINRSPRDPRRELVQGFSKRNTFARGSLDKYFVQGFSSKSVSLRESLDKTVWDPPNVSKIAIFPNFY